MLVTREEKVLVVDNNPADIRLVTSILETKGINVLSAQDGYEGLEIAKKVKPALIVLDLMMPGLSGFEVLERLREEEETKYIPVVVLTMKDLTREELDKLNSQVSAIMQKVTFKREDFLSEVKKAAAMSKGQ